MPPRSKPASEQRRNQPLTGIRLDPETDHTLRVKLAQEHLTKQAVLETLIRTWLLPPELLTELGLDKLIDISALRAELVTRKILEK
ncbi:hypothetical protein [Nocardia sp. CY41]|uniref:hypothetical protein n=1 Tax=Nocardia sp. CY41 TaxID=2608686 RepID=UPI0013568DEB|nr:hypothetical protein [Nocardia sp. CY41]